MTKPNEPTRTSLLRSQHRLLEPFADHVRQMEQEINAMPIRKARTLLAAAEAMTETNCDWAAYALKSFIIGRCGYRIRTHRKAKEPTS